MPFYTSDAFLKSTHVRLAAGANLYCGMKFDAALLAQRRTLEAAQHYRGLMFTDRGEILLDVSNIKDGRVTLSQNSQRLKLLPETIFSLHQAWRDGDIPLDGKTPWECSTFSAHDSEADEVRCARLGNEHIRISNKSSKAEVSISREQLTRIVDCIVEPWLADFSSADARNEIATSQPQANESKPSPFADLS